MKPKCKVNDGKIIRRLLIEDDDNNIFYKDKNDCIRLYYEKKINVNLMIFVMILLY